MQDQCSQSAPRPHCQNIFLKACRNGKHLANCSAALCPHHFKCAKYYCVPFRYTCDGKQDCPLGDDERECSNRTCQGLFKCQSSSMCLHYHDVADGKVDCRDWDDELYGILPSCPMECSCLESYSHGQHLVSCETHTCNPKYFKCPGYYCIAWRYVCNNKWECPGGMDEIDCDRTACPGMFRCKDSVTCISQESLCDDIPDCNYGDDQSFCEGQSCPSNCSCLLYSISCINMLQV